VFTARYALSAYLKQIGFVFKGLNIYTYIYSSNGNKITLITNVYNHLN
jgi:hypothetical protein